MPNKGQNLTVQPVRSLQAVKAMLALAREQEPRDALLLALGFNNGLRCGDLLQLKMAHIKCATVGHQVPLIEGKTRKNNFLVFNQVVMEAVAYYLKHYGARPEALPVFFSKRRPGGCLTSQAAGDLIAGYARAVGLQGRYGCHTLRKTWGYMQIKLHNTNPVLLTQRYNHSNTTVTMRYIGQTEEQVLAICSNGIG